MTANKTFYLFLLSFVITLISLANLLSKTIPLSISHVIYVCQSSLSNFDYILPKSIPLLFTILAGLLILSGVFIFVMQVIVTRRFTNRYLQHSVSIPKHLTKLLIKLGLQNRVRVVSDGSKCSFCYGIIDPKICLSLDLVKCLSQEELIAVLLHEHYHLKNHDPLKIALCKTIASMLFFVPTFARMQRTYNLEKEIAADSASIKVGLKDALLRALTKIIDAKSNFQTVAAFKSEEFLEYRILHLKNIYHPHSLKLAVFNLLLSMGLLLISLKMVITPVHAMPMDKSYFICPGSEECAMECSAKLKTEEPSNFSQAKSYASSTNFSTIK